MSERRYTDRQIYRRVLREARPYWGLIVAIFLITLLATPLALLQPLALKIAVDNVLGGKPLPGWLDAVVPESLKQSSTGLLVFAVLLLVGVELLLQLQSVSKALLRTYTSEQLTLGIRARLFRHAQRLALTYHDRKGTADANYRIQSDAAAVPAVAVDGVMPFAAAGAMFAAMVYVIARIEPRLAAIALVAAPILVLLTWAYRRRLRVRHREVKDLETSALSVVQEALTSIRVVKAFGQERREERRFESRAAQGMRARVRVALVDKLFWIAIGLVTASGAAAVLFVGARSVESGAITLGSLLLVMAYLSQLYGPLYTMTTQVGALQSGFASAERVFTLLDEERDVPERPDARALVRATGAVEFRDVSFAYDTARPVLDGVCFSVERGMRIGIAGQTGAGKTTLVSLLTRFYDPTAGAILLDGVDLRDYRIADLRDQFAIVLQEPVLFSTTIMENIAYGRPDAKYMDMIAAAKAADVHDFVKSLPEGYDTPVGERGMTLSGGERQRISLARAFLKDAPILILDEPTSSVDTQTEAAILEAMERLMAGRTTFMIAHRLGTLESCDVRLELKHGRLAAANPPATRSATGPNFTVPSARPTGIHPALDAWRLFAEGDTTFVGEEIVKWTKPSQVYRLRASSSTQSLIAKRRRADTLDFERKLYEHVLPGLRVRSVSYYGFVQEAGTDFAWLFLEDLGDAHFQMADERHRTEAGGYLGALHSSGMETSVALPDRGPAYYLGCLREGVERLLEGLATLPLMPDDRAMVGSVIAKCTEIEHVWSSIEEACADLPRALVHGDFVGKNVRVLWLNGKIATVPFDWESAGLGLPAPDLAMFGEYELGAAGIRYLEEIRDAWPQLKAEDLRRLADLGVLFRTIHGVAWASFLCPGWLERPLRQLRAYEAQLVPSSTAALRHA